MSIRWKLNFAVSTLIVVFVVAAGFALRAMRQNMASARDYSRTRDLSDLTANLHAGIYRNLRPSTDGARDGVSEDPAGWFQYALRDIGVQARLAESSEEQALWMDLRRAVAALAEFRTTSPEGLSESQAIALAERSLRALRTIHQSAEFDSLATAAQTNLHAVQAIWIAGALALLLFFLYLLLVRRWLLQPIELIKRAADAIGRGELDQSVELRGNDELAQLARRIEAMAARLNEHQQALLKARELAAVGEVCMHVAHGLRNPLGAMQSSAREATAGHASPEQLHSVVRELMHQAGRMDERINKLFEYSRLRPLQRERITFRQVVLTAQAHAFSMLNERNVKLTLDDGTHDEHWQLDGDELAQAIGELMVNAARHSASGSEITVSGVVLRDRDTSRKLQVRVIDRGTGMAPALAEKAFNFFFSTRPDGTGMGLPLVRRIVEQHRGETHLESQMGHGTTVTLILPDAESDDQTPPSTG